MTCAAAPRVAARILAPVSGAEAALDARILLEDATGLDRMAMLRDGDRPLGAAAAIRFAAAVARRQAGEPVWRILGRREFWGLAFEITPAVLDPRPDTETVVAAALEISAARAGRVRLLDLGTGSGAILCALLSELARARGWGVDQSLAACRVARRNVDRLGFGERAGVVHGDWGAAFQAGAFDLVVSNPPYIETAVIATLEREVREHDPLAALDGGDDGLACYRAIVADLPRLLAPGGTAVLEVGAGQAPAVQALLAGAGFVHGQVRRDLGGHVRVAMAQAPQRPERRLF